MAPDGRTRLFYILCVILVVGCVYCQYRSKKEYAETGKSFTFKPNIKGRITIIQWSFEQYPGYFLKLVEWGPRIGTHWSSYMDRGTLTPWNGELTINKLTKEDSGRYEGAFEVDRGLKWFMFELTVIDGVSSFRSQVTCDPKDNTIDLGCSVNPPVKAEFTWTEPDFEAQGERFSIPEGHSKDRSISALQKMKRAKKLQSANS